MKFVREFLLEKTGIKIDQVSSTGGTISTGNVAPSCFIERIISLNAGPVLVSASKSAPLGKFEAVPPTKLSNTCPKNNILKKTK